MLNRNVNKAKQYLIELDLSYIAKRLVHRYSWLESSACSAVVQYKRYLLLLLKYKDKYTLLPSDCIDTVWHEHILYTKKYHTDCINIFGEYLHHHPAEQEGNSQKTLLNFEQTLKLYELEFNEALTDPRYLKIIEKILILYNKVVFVIKNRLNLRHEF